MAPNSQDDADWQRDARLVMAELKRLNITCEALTEQVSNLKVEVATLTTVVQLKSGVWGALAGMIPALAMLIMYLFSRSGR